MQVFSITLDSGRPISPISLDVIIKVSTGGKPTPPVAVAVFVVKTFFHSQFLTPSTTNRSKTDRDIHHLFTNMTESKQVHQFLLSEDSEECENLLDQGELLDKTSIYDLKKIPGVSSSDSEDSNDFPLPASEGRKEVIESTPIAPTSPEDEDDNASQHSEEGYLPAALRPVIPAANKPQTIDTKDLCTSPPLARNKRKPRSIRRTKSDRTKTLSLKIITDDDVLAQSLHSISSKPPSEHELERLCKSEELKKSDNKKSETNRRNSEGHLQRPPLSSRREKGRSRKPKQSKESTEEQPSKSSSARRSKDKPPRRRTKASSKSKNRIPADTQVVEWKRTPQKQTDQPSKESDEKKSLSKQQKPKKSKSAGSNAAKTKRSKPRETRSLSRSRVPKSSKTLTAEGAKDKKEVIGRKGPSPRQLQRKRTQKLKPAEPQQPKLKPLKSTESPAQKPKSRRTLMITDKATTNSCRNLLRKISKINDDRIKQEDAKKPDPIEEKPEPLDELSRSTLSTSLDISRSTLSSDVTDLEDTNHSSSIKPKEEAPIIPEPAAQDGKQKPPRTRSAPLRKVRKEKSSNAKSLLSFNASSSSLLSATMSFSKKEKTNGSSQKKSMKESLSDQLQKFGKMIEDVKGSVASRNGDDKTARMGNRSKDRRNPLKPMTRSRSDSSLGLGTSKNQRPRKRASTSQYDLMLSLHSTDDDYEDYWDSGSDDDDSFSGEEVGDVEEVQNMLEASKSGLETSVKSLSPLDLIKDKEEAVNKAKKSKKKFTASSQRSKNFKFTESANKSKNFKFSESSNKSKNFKFTPSSKNEEVKTDDCDEILSMGEFSEDARETKKPPSCLQIDFSQLAEDGSSGNIVVRAKKLGKRGNKNNRELRTPRSPAVKV